VRKVRTHLAEISKAYIIIKLSPPFGYLDSVSLHSALAAIISCFGSIETKQRRHERMSRGP
jgi:hypothetical protein